MAINRKRRSRQIEFHRMSTNEAVSLLGQWHYRQIGDNGFGPCITYGFCSIVKRRGLPGLWIDRPYCCSAGRHRYRRLPAGLAARLYLYGLNNWFYRTGRNWWCKVRIALSQVFGSLRYWGPSAIRARRDEKRWSANLEQRQ